MHLVLLRLKSQHGDFEKLAGIHFYFDNQIVTVPQKLHYCYGLNSHLLFSDYL